MKTTAAVSSHGTERSKDNKIKVFCLSVSKMTIKQMLLPPPEGLHHVMEFSEHPWVPFFTKVIRKRAHIAKGNFSYGMVGRTRVLIMEGRRPTEQAGTLANFICDHNPEKELDLRGCFKAKNQVAGGSHIKVHAASHGKRVGHGRWS